MLTLYFAPGSSSMAAHIALHEVGAEFEMRPLSFTKREQRQPAYLAINPEGKVPTLVIDGRPLTEVAGILYYLARKYPAAQLWPDDTEDQARAIAWMSFIASALHPARRRGADYAIEVYGIADKRLGERTWVFERFSIVDIHLFRLYWRLAGALGLAPSTFPHLAAHHDRMMQRPAVKKTCEIESRIGYELPDWFPTTNLDTALSSAVASKGLAAAAFDKCTRRQTDSYSTASTILMSRSQESLPNAASAFL